MLWQHRVQRMKTEYGLVPLTDIFFLHNLHLCSVFFVRQGMCALNSRENEQMPVLEFDERQSPARFHSASSARDPEATCSNHENAVYNEPFCICVHTQSSFLASSASSVKRRAKRIAIFQRHPGFKMAGCMSVEKIVPSVSYMLCSLTPLPASLSFPSRSLHDARARRAHKRIHTCVRARDK